MAKDEKIKLGSSNDDFDFDDDWGKTSFEAPKETQNNREPVKKAGRTMLRKMGETTFTTAMAKKILTSALPPSFTVALNNTDNALTSSRQLYRDVATNATPLVREMKNLGRNLNRLLPTRFSNRINAMLRSNGGTAASLGQINMEDLTVSRSIQDIFGQSGALNTHPEDQRNELLKTLTEQEYRAKLGSAITGIQDLLNRQTTYNFTVQRSFQKKSMEIQIRQLMTQRAILDVAQKSAVESSELLRAIVKNSGLPNEVKVRDSEEFKKMMRQRVYGSVQNKLSSWTADYRNAIGQRILQKGKDVLGAFGTGVGLTNDVVEQMLMQREMAEMQGINPLEWASGAAGTEAALWLGSRLGKTVRKRFPSLGKADNPLQRINYFFNNKERLASDWGNSGYDYGKWYHPATNILKDVLRGGYTDQGTIRAGGMRGLESGANDFEVRKLRALEEIIPGYLSRILHSIDIMRTGDNKTQRTTFNQQRGIFTTVAQSAADVRNNLLSQKEIDNQRNGIVNLIGNIDPTNKLSPEAKQTVTNFVYSRSRTSKAFNPSTLANIKIPGLSQEDTQVWRGLLASRYGLTLNTDMRWESNLLKGNHVNLNRDAGDYNFASSQTANLYNRAHALAESGNIEELIQEGAVIWKDGNWVLNRDYYEQRVNGNETSNDAGSEQGSIKQNRFTPRNLRRPTNHNFDLTGGARYDFAGYNSRVNLGDARFSHVGLGQSQGVAFHVALSEQMDRLLAQLTPYQQEQEAGLKTLIAEVQSLQFGGSGNSPETSASETPKGSRWAQRFSRVKRFAQLGGKGIRGYWKATGLPFKAAGIVGRHVAPLLTGGAFGLLRSTGRFLFNKVTDGYIYTHEGLKKVIDKDGLAAGRYIDQKTGQVIKTLSDIKGAIWDKFENTQVLSDEDAKQGLLDSAGKIIKTKATRILQALGGTALKIAMPNFGLTRAAGKVFGFARGLLDKLPDIYVPGEKTPKLFAAKLARGEYYQIATGKRVKSLRDLVGDIGIIDPLTKKLTPVLTAAEIAHGLVNKRGEQIKSGISKAFGLGAGLLRFGLSPVRGAISTLGAVSNLTGSVINGGMNLLGRLIPGRGRAEISKKDAGWLPRIYRLLYNQFTGKPLEDEESILGSAGSVFNRAKGKTADFLKRLKGRSGSWVNRLLSIGKKKPGEKKEEHEKKPSGTGLGSLLLSAIGGIGSILGGIGKGFGKFFSWITGLPKWLAALKGGGVVEDLLDGGKPKGKAGLLRRAGRGLLKAGKFLGKGAIAAGAFLGRGLLSAGGVAVRGAIAGGEAIAGAAAAVGSVPLVVGAAIAVGVGYLIYKGWQAYSNRMTDLRAYRVAAYGFDPKNKEQAGKVLALEEAILKNSRIDGNGKLSVAPLNYYELMSGFDIPSTDQRAVLRWTRWYRFRFLPIFTRSVEVLYQRDKKAKITSAEFLTPAQRPQYARDTFIPITGENSPYTITDSPFLNGVCIIGEHWPGNFRDQIIAKYRNEEKAQPPLKGALTENTAPVSNRTAQVVKRANSPVSMAQNTAPITDMYFSPGDKGAPLGSITGNPSRDELYMMGNRIDDLTSIRVKMYGLTSLVKEDVNQLLSFERTLYPDVRRGSKGEMTYTKSTDETFVANFGHFGVNPNNPDEKAQWTYWFEHRFLPVYLNFLAETKKIQPNISPFNAWQKFTSSDLLMVANTMNRAVTSVNGKSLSIWVITSSPWPKRTSGTDPSIIDPNLEALRSMAKRETYSENLKIQNTISKETYDGKSLNKTTVGRKIADFQSDLLGATANSNARGVAGNANAQGAYAQHFQSYGTSYDVSGAGLDYVNDNVAHLGKGSGGSINSLPQSTGNGWDANKDLIVAAAKMAGVDAGSLAAMIAQESSFNPTAGSQSSSAKGLGQFTAGTWKEMLPILVSKYGVNPNTPPTDPRANVLATAEYMKQNAKIIGDIGRPLTTTDIYMAHFLGPGAAKRLLNASPDTDIRTVLGGSYDSVANANRNIFDGVRTAGDLTRKVGSFLMRNGGKYISQANDLANSTVSDMATAGGVSKNANGGGTATAVTPTTPPIPAGAKTPLPSSDVAKSIVPTKGTALTPPIPQVSTGPSESFSTARSLNDNITNAQARAVRIQQDTTKASSTDQLNTGDSMNQSLGIFKSMDQSLLGILKILQGMGGNKNGDQSPNAKETDSEQLLNGSKMGAPALGGSGKQPRPFSTQLNLAKYK